MKISREWATPLTIGSFAIMAVTGTLMFFHADVGLNKLAHEWLGWAMIAGVAAHAVANWTAFKRYFVSGVSGRAIMGLSAVVLAATFVQLPSPAGGGPAPPALAMRAVVKAPISAVAPLTGKPVGRLIDDLRKAGVELSGPDASLDSVLKGNRELQGKALRILFAKG